MDWWEFLYSFVGSFLGFGFAILAEELFEHQKNINDRKKLFRRCIVVRIASICE